METNRAAPSSLNVTEIAAALGDLAKRFDVEVVDRCDSTNARMMQRAEAGAPSGSVLVALEQTAGRGRRGRVWVSAAGDSLTFSLLWRFPPACSLSGLSLAVGLALVRVLARLPLAGLALKWPNDVLLGEGKLAGVLIEVAPAQAQAQATVIGIGVNLKLPPEMPEELRSRAAHLPGPLPATSQLLASFLVELHSVLSEFASAGFARLRAEWLRYHAYQLRPVQLLSDFAAPLVGICQGVDVDGALLLETATGVQRIISGEISLRQA